jgi:hypothetical protein
MHALAETFVEAGTVGALSRTKRLTIDSHKNSTITTQLTRNFCGLLIISFYHSLYHRKNPPVNGLLAPVAGRPVSGYGYHARRKDRRTGQDL